MTIRSSSYQSNHQHRGWLLLWKLFSSMRPIFYHLHSTYLHGKSQVPAAPHNYNGHSGSHLYSIVYFRCVAQIWNLKMKCYSSVGFNSTTPHIAKLWSFLLSRRQGRGALQFHNQAAKKDHLGLLHVVTTSVLLDWGLGDWKHPLQFCFGHEQLMVWKWTEADVVQVDCN